MVNPIVARFSLPVLDRSNARCTVSPGTRPDALTVNRLVAAPVAPNAIVTVPDVTLCDADVVDVNVANVPKPIPAAAPRAPKDKSTFLDVPPNSFIALPFWRSCIATLRSQSRNDSTAPARNLDGRRYQSPASARTSTERLRPKPRNPASSTTP